MSDTPAWLQLVVVALAATRITVLVVADAIADRPRDWLMQTRPPWVSVLLSCFWCVGWWVGIAFGLAWLLWPVGTATVAVPLAVAYACGHLPPDPS
jgi:hypothetical protein